MITAQTKVCMIIGDPVEHSFSPALHNAAYQAAGIAGEFVFVAARVIPEELEQAIKGIKSLGIRGISCTVPHKVAVMHYMDELDPIAQKIGAVNTIVNEAGKLKGYNTDWIGALTALQKKIEIRGKKIALLGVGGAARAVVYGLLENGGEVTAYNRTPEKAQAFAVEWEIAHGSLENLEELRKADIIINTTTVGMSTQETLVPAEYLESHHLVMDIVYRPRLTKLLSDAQQKGATIIFGTDMLFYQALPQFELYTGQKADEEVMKKAFNDHHNE